MEQLKELSNDLFFLSESESPFEVLHYPTPSNNDNLYPQLRQWSGIPTDARIEEEELEHFFRNHTIPLNVSICCVKAFSEKCSILLTI